MFAVFCKWHGPGAGWQAVRVQQVSTRLPIGRVDGLLRVTTEKKVRGGWFVDPKELALS